MTDSGWTIALEPAVLLPDRPVTVDLVYTPGRDHEFRGVTVVLRCVERYRFDRTQTALGSNGHMTSRRVTVNQTKELARFEAQVAGPGQAVRGAPISWQTRFDVPGLGQAGHLSHRPRARPTPSNPAAY